MSPPEIEVAPDLIGQVLDAVDKGFERQLAFTQQMMAFELARAGTCVVAITTILIIGEFISNRIRNRLI